jgi:hypothetical protein
MKPPHTWDTCPAAWPVDGTTDDYPELVFCVCLTPEQVRDYVTGGDNSRWLRRAA